MQNKANVKIGKMNLRSVDTKDYENISDWTLGENKPNQSQFQAGSLPAISVAGLSAVGGTEDSPQDALRQIHMMENKVNYLTKYRWKILPAAAVFNPIKKLTIGQTSANLKSQRIIKSQSVVWFLFWIWGTVQRMAKPRTCFWEIEKWSLTTKQN